MPRLSREIEDKIMELIDQGYKDAVISRELGVHRTTIADRRKAHLKRNQIQEEKPEPEKKEVVRQEQTDPHPLDQQIYTLIRYQGTNSREEAISQAIQTIRALNPYVLNHQLRTPEELVKFFEDEIRVERDNVNDLEIESKISRSLVFTCRETNAKLKELTDERYEEGHEQGKREYSINFRCAGCGGLCLVTPNGDTHRHIIEMLAKDGWGHASCLDR